MGSSAVSLLRTRALFSLLCFPVFAVQGKASTINSTATVARTTGSALSSPPSSKKGVLGSVVDLRSEKGVLVNGDSSLLKLLLRTETEKGEGAVKRVQRGGGSKL